MGHYLGMNAASCYWSYIDFYTLISNNYILTDTYNSDTALGQNSWAPTGGVLKNFGNITGKHLCWSLFLTTLQVFRPAALLKKTPTQVFSCEMWEILKDTYFEEHLNDCFCVLITSSSSIDFYNPLQYTFIIFTNNFFITQLKK